MLGNEAHGLPDEVLAAVDHVIRIPILGRAESLNLATAAAVCLYAAARVRPGSPRRVSVGGSTGGGTGLGLLMPR